ncbi:MAG: extracellular solute-binding protein [Oscillospiraceae bacterium]
MAKKQGMKLKKITSLFMSAMMAATTVQFQMTFGAAAENSAGASGSSSVSAENVGMTSKANAYKSYIENHADAPKPMKDVVVDVQNYTADGVDVEIKDFQGEEDCVAWFDSKGAVSWSFNVETAGLYNLEMFYYPVAGQNTTVEVGLKIDGKNPFDEVKLVELDRYWHSQTSIEFDERKKNQKRPPQVEYDCWVTYPIKDKDGLINTPYFFYLDEGSHTITLEAIKTNLYIKGMRFFNSEELPDYASIAPSQSDIENTPALSDNQAILIEAEAPLYTSASTLYPTYDRTDYNVSSMHQPNHPVNKRYNTIGTDTWDQATQSICYEFEVPSDGYYSVQLKARQSKMRGFFSNRRVYIDGVVPCKELDDVKIQYDPDWQTVELCDAAGEPIYLYLTAGKKHQIMLEAIPGDIGEVMQRLDDLIFELNYYYRRILMITGPSPDEFNDYFLDEQIPELIDVLQHAVDTLYAEKAGIEALTGEGSEASTLQTMAVILEMAIEDPDDIPVMLSSIKDQISSVSAWMRDYRDQPLELDYIEVKTVHDKYKNAKSNFFKSFAFGFRAFVGSFFEDYTTISDTTTKALNVWVSLGRDQATVVNELVSSGYNPNRSTKIAISLVQGAVLEATLAGKGPEIALFIGGDFPVVCASRGLLYNMMDFGDHEEVFSRFTDDVTTLYKFQNGIYAVPLTQNFPMLFYRTDVLEELGYDNPPESWNALIDMLPDLQRKYLEVGLILPSNVSSQVFDAGNTFVLLMNQTGQSFYNDNYTATTFDTEAAVEAFTKWTKFYTVYDFDQAYDAFTRFRTGEMPICIQNYTFYNQLNVAAPEIKGLWNFTHVPGSYRYDENGNRILDYTANSGSAGAVIFKSCSDPDAAWDFIKWFTSTETQVEYGRTIEAIMGPLGRYDTANVEALSRLNWSTAEYEKINDQMMNLREVPIIPASYAVTRNVYNAFRAVVNNQKNPRYQLSSYNRDINSEIVRKLKELGYYEEEG